MPDDLHEIIQHLATHSPAAADRFAESSITTIDELAKTPGIGSPKHFRSRVLAGIRSWPVAGFPNHLILYQPIENGIEVLAVIHGARRLSRISKGRI